MTSEPKEKLTPERLAELAEEFAANIRNNVGALRASGAVMSVGPDNPDVMASSFKPGITDMYQFVDWLKYKKYRVPQGQVVTITGLGGGLVNVEIKNEDSRT